MAHKPKVVFIHVTNPQSKIGAVCRAMQKSFDRGKRALIMVPNDQAAKYVDALLWKLPIESFLPHSVSTSPCDENIVITKVQKNLNQASLLLNLCAELSPILMQFQTVYELYDETDAQKKRFSQKRYAAYQKSGLYKPGEILAVTA